MSCKYLPKNLSPYLTSLLTVFLQNKYMKQGLYDKSNIFTEHNFWCSLYYKIIFKVSGEVGVTMNKIFSSV